jgi:hypothetical protein
MRLNELKNSHLFFFKPWTPPIEAFSAPKIVKNIIELRKLQAFEVEGVKNSKK